MRLLSKALLAGGILTVLAASDASGVEFLYTFEGDGATLATDKIAGDGAQNGSTLNNVDTSDSFSPAFGTQSAFFDNPLVGTPVPAYSTLEIPETTFGPDFSLTLAGFAYQDPAFPRRVRLFSSYQGTGGINDSLLFDFNTQTASPTLRGIVDGTSLFSPALPTLPNPGYHHYAMTISAGTMKYYFDGAEVFSGTLPAGYQNTNSNIFVAEDPHNGGGTANEQLLGNVDNILVLQRALAPADIASLAAGTAAPSFITPLPGERAVYYDFEGDSGSMVTDKFTSDGSQNGVFHALANVDTNAAYAKFGSGSATFTDPRANDPIPFSQINAGQVGSLGTTFTVSAVINPLSAGQFGNGFARVFSSYLGAGSTAGQLILDVNPTAVTGNAIRLYLPNNTGTPTLQVLATVGKADLDAGTQQTLTATYDNGNVTLYLDGVEIASAVQAPALQTLGENDLRIGEDRGGYLGHAANENFIGNMDDVMLLTRALTAEEVTFLHANGAEALLATLPTPTLSGDYNQDGLVDAADYTVWRDELAAGSGLTSDGNGDGVVNAFDFDVWRLNYGSSLPGGGQAVPEPTSAALALLGIGIACRRRQVWTSRG